MNEQRVLQHSLIKFFEESKRKNARFGIRAFAKRLGIAPSALSEFLNGKRQFSRKMAERLILRLNISPADGQKILSRFPSKRKDIRGRMELNKRELQIQSDHYFLVADSIYYSLLCLVETVDFKEDYEWMAKRLKTTEAKVKAALDRLMRLDLITRDETGKLKATEKRLNTTDDVTNLSLRKRHEDNMETAKIAIHDVDTNKRYFIFETLAFDPDKLDRAKTIMSRAREELIALSTDGEKKEVYEFCFVTYPRTEVNEEKTC